MTDQQIKWALGHDWALGASHDGNGVMVLDVEIDTITGERFEEPMCFTDYRALRAWAGY